MAETDRKVIVVDVNKDERHYEGVTKIYFVGGGNLCIEHKDGRTTYREPMWLSYEELDAGV